MATRAFSASKWGEQLFAQAGARRLTVATLGESFGLDDYLGAAIQYAVWRYHHADIVFDHRAYADGGTMFAVGGTTTTGVNGLTDQLVQFQARPADIAFIASGYNDQPDNAAEAATVAATVAGVADDLFAAGAKYVAICGISPRNHDAAAFMAYNQLIRNYCAATQGAFFCDTTSAIVDMQNSGGASMPYRDIATNAAGTYGSYTSDGTHWSGLAIRLIAQPIADILRKIAGERTPRQCFNAGDYDPADKPYANILGDAGMCMGTSGILGAGFDTGVAGTGTTSRLVISTVGPVTATPSIIEGTNGERKQRIALGGSGVSGAPFIELSCTPTITGANGGVATRMMDFECTIELTGVIGLADIWLRPATAANDSMKLGGNSPSSQWLDGATETLFARTLYPVAVPTGNNPKFSIFFQFGDGSNPAGTIDVSRMSAMVVEE